jgi:nucleoid-associated protein YgaU
MTASKARLAAAQLGGATGGELERLAIWSERGEVVAEALFNPGELSTSRTVEWDAPRRSLQGNADHEGRAKFRSVAAETLSVELFFDTYEPRAEGAFGRLPGAPASGGATDVRQHTERVLALADVDAELHRPVICNLRWGTFDVFTGAISSISQRFTLFLADGTPVRATLDCSFLESNPAGRGRARELHSADVTKTRLVRGHDTLHSIAGEEYSDPALWRHIATANGITNPRHVAPGTMLTIPKLRT